MEAELREQLQEKRYEYITDTFRDVRTVERFCDKSEEEKLDDYIIDTLEYVKTIKDFYFGKKQEWISERKTELSHLREINTKVKDMDQDDSRRKDLEKELGEVLKKTLEGLEILHHFLDAVEKLAVTSLYIFMDENLTPHGASHISVISAISTARTVSPLLLHFKRDAGAFFLPILNNMDTLEFQLNQYILITQQICELMENGSRNLSDAITRQMNVSERTHDQIPLKKENVEKQSEHLLQLTNIRKDEKFRMCFLFNNEALDFIKLFSESRSRMFKFLSELEEAADDLDRMKKGSDISTVVGSSVGIAGGGLSIAGVALAPFTAGASLGLTLVGAGLGVTSGVTSVATYITEKAVNDHHEKKANNIFTSFMEDVQKILDCIEVAANTERPVEGPDGVNTASVIKLIRNNLGIGKAGYQGAKGIGKFVKGAPMGFSKVARVGLVGLNALFIGLDAYFIVDSSRSLAKGSKNEVAQDLRDRSVLWRSEVEAWEKIHDHLCKEISGFQKNLEILERLFYI